MTDQTGDEAQARATERRRLIDLTRREKGYPERRDLGTDRRDLGTDRREHESPGELDRPADGDTDPAPDDGS